MRVLNRPGIAVARPGYQGPWLTSEWSVPSSTGPGAYIVRFYFPEEFAYCACPAWNFSQNRRCKHILAVENGDKFAVFLRRKVDGGPWWTPQQTADAVAARAARS